MFAVHRRTGGLENGDGQIHCVEVVHRRTGGLEIAGHPLKLGR